MLTTDPEIELNEEPEESRRCRSWPATRKFSDVGVSAVAEYVARELATMFDRLPIHVVTAVVREAESELVGQVTDGAFAELLYRLAAAQLEQLHAQH